MGNRIKGITIEIDGDTKGLDKALSNITKESTQTARELKDVNKLLKLNPGNTELVAQKQILLSKSVKTTSDKLEKLKQAQAQVDAEYKKGNIGEEQYRSFNRELQATEGQLNGYKSELASVEQEQAKLAQSTSQSAEKTKTMSQRLDEVAGKSEKVGKAMSVGVTAPIVGVGTAAVKSFKDVTTVEEDVIRQTGATGKKADALRQSFENVAGNSAADFDQVGLAVGGVSQRLGLTGGALEKASSQFLKFAAINKVDVDTAITTVSRAMGDAGIKSKDYGKVLDMLTVAHQKSGIAVDTLAENLAKFGAPMRNLGFDTKSTIAMFSGWEHAGVNTSIAFSGMKKAISTWGKENKKPMEEFPKAMEKIKNSSNPVADAIEIFGAKAGPDLADAITQGRFSFEDYSKALDKSSGAVNKSAKNTGNSFKDFKAAMHSVSIALADLGKQIMGTAAPAIKGLITHVKGITSWFKQLSPSAKQTAVGIGAILAAIGPTLIVFSKTIKTVKKVKDAFDTVKNAVKSFNLISKASAAATKVGELAMKGWSAVTKAGAAIQTAFNAVMAINPFILTIAAIAVVVGALVYFFGFTKTGKRLWKEFTDWLGNLWQGVAKFFSELWKNITQIFTNAVNGIGQFLHSGWGQALMFLINPIGGIVNFIVQHWKQIKQITTQVFSAIGQFLSSVWNGIKNTISKFVNGIKTKISTTWNGIKSVTSSVFNGIKSVASNVWNGIKSTISRVVNGIKSTVSNVWNGIKSVTSGVWNGIKSAMTSPINAAKGVISGIINTIKGLFKFKLKFPKVSIPHIPLPHFSLKGSFNPLKMKVPSIGISWYAKGGIFNKPTLFNTPQGMKGVGEAGSEAVLPLNARTLGGIGKGIAEQMNVGQNQAPVFNITLNVKGNENEQTARQMADTIMNEIQDKLRNQYGMTGGGIY